MCRSQKAFLALLLLVPAPSIGVLCGMIIFPHSPAGNLLFAASKLWLFGLPVVWLRFVDHAPFSFSPPKQGGFAAGILTGIALSGMILFCYWAIGNAFVDQRLLTEKLIAIGLGSRGRYIGGALYWIMINSILEEYAWRWFCVRQCEQLLPKRAAVICSALFFTMHHVLAMAVYLGPAAVALCALGVFAGGAVWSWMYIKYRSIWPAYVSHALVDLCIFGIGAYILFGAS